MALVLQDAPIFTWEGQGEVKAIAVGRTNASPVLTFRKPNGALTLVVKGKPQGEYLEVSPVKISDDGQSFVAAVRGSGGYQIVTQQGPGAELPDIFQQSLAISADGRHYAVGGSRPNGLFVLVDGAREIKISAPVNEIVFHPGGAQLAIACEDALIVASVDGSIVKQIPGGRHAVWSPDGKRFAHLRVKGLDYRVVVDGKESPAYNTARSIVFSPDGKRCAWIAQDQPAAPPPRRGRPQSESGKSMLFVVLDHQPQKPFASVREIAFSPDGKECSYFGQVEEGKAFFLVVNGKIGTQQSQVPRGLMYAGGDRVFISRDGGQDAVVVGDRRAGALRLVTDIVYSGTKICWVGLDGEQWFYGTEKTSHVIIPGTLRAEGSGVSYLARTPQSVIRVTR